MTTLPLINLLQVFGIGINLAIFDHKVLNSIEVIILIIDNHKYECCTKTQHNSEMLEYTHQSTIIIVI